MAYARGDMTVLSVGGNSLLGIIREVRYRGEIAQVDGSVLNRVGLSAQPVGKDASFETTNHSVLSAPLKVSALDVSAFTIGGGSYVGLFSSFELSGTNTFDEARGGNNIWSYKQFITKDYSATGTIRIDDASNVLRALHADFHNAGTNTAQRQALQMALAFTINGVSVSVPMTLTNVEHGVSESGVQQYTVTLSGQSPDTGDYPTAPTGTSTLLEKAFNAPQTALAILFTPIGTVGQGGQLGGNVKIASFQISVQERNLVLERYTFVNDGPITWTNN